MGAKNLKWTTLEEWIELDTDERLELIEGEIVHRTNPSADHSFSASKMASGLDPLNCKPGGGGGNPGGWWIYSEAHVLYSGRPNGFVHDLAGWKRDKLKDRPRGKKISERPDWVCEILSSNRGSDLIRKKKVLHEHRVPYYWILDHRDQILTVMQWVEGGYLSIQEVSPKTQNGKKIALHPFTEIELSIELLFGIED